MASVDGEAWAAFLPSESVLNLNASIAKGPVALKAFARIVTDRRAWVNGSFGLGPPNAPAEGPVSIIQPRTIGVGFDYVF
jgi:hypothetical protein